MSMGDNKTVANNQDPKRFILQVDNTTRQKDGLILLDIFTRITGMPAVMWGDSIIGFGSYNYTTANGKQESFFRCGFSPRKQNLSLYVRAALSEHSDLLASLGKHKTSKACLYINKLSDIDMSVLEKIITLDFAVMNARYP